MPRIVTRAEWGARKPKAPFATVPLRTRAAVCIHHDGANAIIVRSFKEAVALVRKDEAYHIDSNGWAGIGYNFLVISAPGYPDIDGLIFEARGRDAIGAHCQDHNQLWIGIQVATGGRGATDQKPSPAALASTRWLTDDLSAKAGFSLAKRGHMDGFPTECPGPILQAWVRAGMPVAKKAATQLPLIPATQEDDMVILRHSNGHHFISNGQTKREMTSPQAETAWMKAGVKVVAMPDAEIATIPMVGK